MPSIARPHPVSAWLGLGILLTAGILPPAALAQDAFADLPRAQLLLLGTFHFDDQGLDSYVPEFPWDPLTVEHQREIEDVVERLARFRPTRIAIEWPARRQRSLDSTYQAFLAGRAELTPNERQQIGFRLARRLGHERVYAVDAPARSYFPSMTQGAYDSAAARLMDGADPALLKRQVDLEARFQAAHRFDDSLKTTMPLRNYLLRVNVAANLLRNHGEYLIGSFYLGRDDDYLGPDMRTGWYNRNLRIFHNIQRITASPAERLLLIIGAGHVPILRHAAEASPEFHLVDAGEYLGG